MKLLSGSYNFSIVTVDIQNSKKIFIESKTIRVFNYFRNWCWKLIMKEKGEIIDEKYDSKNNNFNLCDNSDNDNVNNTVSPEVFLSYPPILKSKDCVTIFVKDLSRLMDSNWINDNIVDFAIKYAILNSDVEAYYAYSSFFYRSVS